MIKAYIQSDFFLGNIMINYSEYEPIDPSRQLWTRGHNPLSDLVFYIKSKIDCLRYDWGFRLEPAEKHRLGLPQRPPPRTAEKRALARFEESVDKLCVVAHGNPHYTHRRGMPDAIDPIHFGPKQQSLMVEVASTHSAAFLADKGWFVTSKLQWLREQITRNYLQSPARDEALLWCDGKLRSFDGPTTPRVYFGHVTAAYEEAARNPKDEFTIFDRIYPLLQKGDINTPPGKEYLKKRDEYLEHGNVDPSSRSNERRRHRALALEHAETVGVTTPTSMLRRISKGMGRFAHKNKPGM